MHRNPRKKTRRHRHREQVRDPTEAKYPAQGHDEADQQRQKRRHLPVFGRSGCRKHGKSADKDRRDGRIRARREKAVGTKQGKGHGTGHEGGKSDRRAEARLRKSPLTGARLQRADIFAPERFSR